MPTALLLALILGGCLAAVVAVSKRGQGQRLAPVIHRRLELRKELEELLGQGDASALLRAVAARMRRPNFDLGVLEKAVELAKQRVRRREADRSPAPVTRD